MAGKVPLLTHLTDEIGGLRAAFARALADNHVTAAEAADLKGRIDRAHLVSQRCDLAQRDGLSRVRYGESARDTIREMESLSAMRLEHRLRGRTRRTA